MTVYPFQIHFGAFTITGYGIMMMVAFLVAGWVYAKEVQRIGLDPGVAWDTVVFAVIGGLVGAKVYYAVLFGDPAALLSRGGLVWYGGFAGGLVAVFGYMWWKRLPIRRLLDAIAPAMFVGYCLGRVGCFLVGDDYGRPTSLPWGIRFPQGAPPSTAEALRTQFHIAIPAGVAPTTVLAVHPTQLYEVTLAFLLFWLLWKLRRHAHAPGWLFGLYLILVGAERAFVEIFRAKDDRFFGPLSVAQVISFGIMALGGFLMTRYRTPIAQPATPSTGA